MKLCRAHTTKMYVNILCTIIFVSVWLIIPHFIILKTQKLILDRHYYILVSLSLYSKQIVVNYNTHCLTQSTQCTCMYAKARLSLCCVLENLAFDVAVAVALFFSYFAQQFASCSLLMLFNVFEYFIGFDTELCINIDTKPLSLSCL